MCENHLFKLKEKGKKDVEGVILGQNDLKSPILDERRRKKVQREVKVSLTRKLTLIK